MRGTKSDADKAKLRPQRSNPGRIALMEYLPAVGIGVVVAVLVVFIVLGR